jgi:CRISPR-associated protein Csb2
MIALAFVFPWGRYYAHPWGLNPVRLREAEWPPSPWRLLRALASAWFRSHPGCTVSQDAVNLLESLGQVLPEIGIGKVTFGQTVHYQPNYGTTADKDDARYKNTRHENHFAAVHGPVIFRWPNIELLSPQEDVLRGLLANLSYFGRAESICHAEPITAEEIEAIDGIGWCRPTSGRRISARCRDVFCPNSEDFHVTDLWARRDGKPNVDSEDAPAHLVDALLSSDMKVAGAKWVSYEMPEDWPAGRVVRTARIAKKQRGPTNAGPRIVRYLRFSLQCRVPIHPKFTVPIAEQFRAAASRHFQERFGDRQNSFALFGHQEDRPEEVSGEHQHAFFLPTRTLDIPSSLEERGSITDLHVWCPYGLTEAETQVLQRIQRLVWKDGRYPVRPVLTAMGMEPPQGLALATGNIKSRVWRSETPFLPPRHFYRTGHGEHKMREAESPERQLITCLRQAGIMVSGEVRRLTFSGEQQETLGSLPPLPYWSIVRAPDRKEAPFAGAVVSPIHTNGGGTNSEPNRQRIGFFMEIAFDTEVALPMPAFGHSNHFGLGLFVPVRG